MAQSLRFDFKTDLASTFVEDIQYKRSRYYYFLGGVNAGVPDTPASITITPTDETNRKLRSEISFVKQISSNDVSLVINRNDWTTGTVYDYWDHTIDMTEKVFYVVNKDSQVYKCLDNNDGGASTVEPTGARMKPFQTSDGYIWKYMYTINSFKNTKFTTATRIPVQRALTDSFYNNGSIDSVAVLDTGSGYANTTSTSITVSSATLTGQNAAGTVTVNNTTGEVTGVVMTNNGTGYTAGVRVVFSGPSGATGATGYANISGGQVIGVVITNGGYGYTDPGTTVSFQTGNAVLVPFVSSTTGSITSVKIVDPGIGYATAPTLTVVGSGGSGLYGTNPTALLSCVVVDGEIKHVNITDPGESYPVGTTTTISVSGDGSGAQFTPVVYGGKIIGVVTENAGTGYSQVKLTANTTPAPTTTAQLSGIISQSDYSSDQMVVEQTAVKGAIYKIKLQTAGNSYLNPIVTVTGNGTGCTATATINTGTGAITKITVTNPGSGYTWANVTITDPTSVETPATAYAILPPIGGHGSNAPSELMCHAVAVNTPLRGDVGIQGFGLGTLQAQEFRTFGLIKNPTNVLTGANYTALSSLLAYKMAFTSTTGLLNDSILYAGTGFVNKFRVFQVSSTTVYLIPLDSPDIVPLGLLSTLQGGAGTQYTSTEVLAYPDFDKYSGQFLYVSTENPFTFTTEQSIIIKTFIEF